MKLRRIVPLLLALLLFAFSSISYAAPMQQAPRCKVFNETGGFSVCDDANASFLSALEGWQLQRIGYPISQRYQRDGFVTQAFQKAIMQWQPDGQYVALVNVFDDLHSYGFDSVLLEVRQTPLQLPPNWDVPGSTFAQIVERRQALLSTRPALRQSYFSVANPLLFFGLPTSEVTDMGNHYAIRLQRTVLQEWKEDVPWARAGQVTIANGGDIAKELKALPVSALVPDGGAPRDTFLDFLGTAATDIDDFWYTEFTKGELAYDSVATLQPYNEPVDTACGTTQLGNGSYCSLSASVYFDLEFLRALNDIYGDFAAVIVLAHEWGHHVQAQLGITREYSISSELMADCFAGAYAWDAQNLGILDWGDVEEAQASLANSGDVFGTPWYDSAAHGRPQERLLAFNTGYNTGIAACLDSY